MSPAIDSIEPVALSTEQAAIYIGMSVEYLKRARIDGKGPSFSKIGRRVVYQVKDLQSFLERHRQQNTCSKIR